MYWNDSGGLQLSWITSRTGLTFSAGAIAALSAFALAGIFLKPGFDRLAVLGDEQAQVPGREAARREAENLAARLRPISLFQVALLLFAASAMAMARYVP